MYNKPQVSAMSHAVDVIQGQFSFTKILPFYADVCQIGHPVNQALTAAAYEADE
jgi:hypothetical protein